MKLYEAITAENWIQGGGGFDVDGRERLCLGLRMQKMYDDAFDRGIVDRIEAAITALFPYRVGRSAIVLVKFNDHPDTTVEDIIRVCKVADV